MVCWCCGTGPEARDSKWACPKCEAHGANRHMLTDQEKLQAHRSFRAVWLDQEAWAAAEARMMKEMEEGR